MGNGNRCYYCGELFDREGLAIKSFVRFQEHSESCGPRRVRLERLGRSAFGDFGAAMRGEPLDSECFVCGAEKSDDDAMIADSRKRICAVCRAEHRIAATA